MANHLEIPDDLKLLSNNTWSEFDSIDTPTISIASIVDNELVTQAPLIDADEFQKMFDTTDPWIRMKEAMDLFPTHYLAELRNYRSENTTSVSSYPQVSGTARQLSETADLTERMRKFIDDECTVFTPNDPTLRNLEEALKLMKHRVDSSVTSEIDSIEDPWWRRRFSYSEFVITPPTEYLQRALARATEYELPTRYVYNEQRCRDWVEENFLKRMDNI